MNEEQIEKMLLEIYKFWILYNREDFLNKNQDAKSILRRQSIFDESKKIVQSYLDQENL